MINCSCNYMSMSFNEEKQYSAGLSHKVDHAKFSLF